MGNKDVMTDKDRLLSLLDETPTTRGWLATRLGWSKNKVERVIGELRDAGEPVCSNSETKGYWLSTGADFTRTIKEMEHRALVILERTRKMKNKQLQGQIEMEV